MWKKKKKNKYATIKTQSNLEKVKRPPSKPTKKPSQSEDAWADEK